MDHMTKEEMQRRLERVLTDRFGTEPNQASDELLYKALATVVNDILADKRKKFMADTHSHGRKQVYYLCMEFLMGRSLKNNLYNLGLVDAARGALAKYKAKLENLFECEPDAGLGNGGLGRLAACYLDGLATQAYPAMGYSICYEYGIFRQKIIDGWQTELPDNWLPGGEVWLTPAPEQGVDVHFGGEVEEFWEQNYHHVHHKNYNTVRAVPYDMYVSGYDSKGVSQLRLWRAVSSGFDMESFNRGDYAGAMSQSSINEAISKVLYPNDNHLEGKALRLRQQYFLVAASIGDIVNKHMSTYGTLDNLAEKVAIHTNDTHPALAIPELMRILLDDCGYQWDFAWQCAQKVFAFTNHTVLSEALEVWNEDLFKSLLPRIYQIVREIDNRLRHELYDLRHANADTVERMAIISGRTVRMANLSLHGGHSVNGVARLHSEIIKRDVFADYYHYYPEKFTNVTNGIASRRWLYQSDPGLTKLLCDTIGDGFLHHMTELERFMAFKDDRTVLERLAQIKRENKEAFAAYLKKHAGVTVDPDTIFDVQVKRLHEYKRQHLNGLHILAQYLRLKADPNADFIPTTYLFGAKAAPGYFMAKQIIKFLCSVSKLLESDPAVKGKLQLVYLEDYRVTLSELITPAAEVSEQISLAGKEASGTGNMKLMINGAVTLGTLDGANVEINDLVGDDNMILFGMRVDEVEELRRRGYRPMEFAQRDPALAAALEMLRTGIAGDTFPELYQNLTTSDPYMVLADFGDYARAHRDVQALYRDQTHWQQMSRVNIAKAGFFCADRAVDEYAQNIWHLR